MSQYVEFSIHWLTLTMWSAPDLALQKWQAYLQDHLGPMVPQNFGGPGFRQQYKALESTTLKIDPIYPSNYGTDYVSLNIPGSACEALPPTVLAKFYSDVRKQIPISATRLDLTWDGLEITPKSVRDAILARDFKSAAHSSSLTYWEQPLEENEAGKLGTTSVQLGSKWSERQLKVYDRRGFSRLELLTRKARADLVAQDVFSVNPGQWSQVAIGHLRDFVDFQNNEGLLPWWEGFVTCTPRAHGRIVNARIHKIEKMENWILKQASPSISVLVDVNGIDYLQEIYKTGKLLRGRRFDAILQLAESETSKKEIK